MINPFIIGPMSSVTMISNLSQRTRNSKRQLVVSVAPIAPAAMIDSRPEVVLDTTLSDLYEKDQQDGDKSIVLVPCYWCSDIDYTDSVSKTAKYLYQGTPPPTTKIERRELVIQCLSLESQRFTFAAGKMDTVIFDLEDRTGYLDALKTLNVLPMAQRPNVTSALGIKDLIYKKPESQFSLVVPHEEFPSKAQMIQPEVLYNLLSKRYLVLSGLPTPKSSILDLDTRSGSITHKLTLAASWILSFELPRVFKTQQGMSSVGTFIVKSEAEREELICNLVTGILQSTLQRVNVSNEHLLPSSLIAQELITQSSDCFATSFFVRKSGDCEFLGACRQDMSETNAWLGASIRYLEQDRLRRRLSPVIAKIAAFLHSKGYHGPAGADIITDDLNVSNPKEWVIDLNVRMTGSLTLAFLKGHFSDRRNLHEACITQRFKFQLGRDSFRNYFAQEVREGRLIIVAWFHDPTADLSWGNLILAAEDGEKLKSLTRRVRKIALN